MTSSQTTKVVLLKLLKIGLNNVDADSTKQKFEDAGEHIEPKRDANGNIIKDEFVVTDKANANKDAKEEAKAVKAAEKKAPAEQKLKLKLFQTQQLLNN